MVGTDAVVDGPNRHGLASRHTSPSVPERVERHDPEGVDYGWVMQTTFVTTIVAGVPVVALLSLAVPPQETWAARAEFALRVGAVVWLVTNVAVYLYAARATDGDDSAPDGERDDAEGADDDASDDLDGTPEDAGGDRDTPRESA